MKQIITIQHCQSEQHVNGMMGGWNDWALTELGRRQAERIGERLGAELSGQSVKIYASDLKRAMETAAPLAKTLGVPVEYRRELREKNFGPLADGKTKEWYRKHCDNFGNGVDDRCISGAETKREMYERLGPPTEAMNHCGIFGKAGAIGVFDIFEGWERRILRIGDLSYWKD